MKWGHNCRNLTESELDELDLRLEAVGPGGKTLTSEVPLNVVVLEDPWLTCFWYIPAGAAGITLLRLTPGVTDEGLADLTRLLTAATDLDAETGQVRQPPRLVQPLTSPRPAR